MPNVMAALLNISGALCSMPQSLANARYYSVSTKKRPLSIMVQYSKYLANIIEIFTTEFSIYLYIICKNSWKFNVKIVFYYMFSMTRSRHKFP